MSYTTTVRVIDRGQSIHQIAVSAVHVASMAGKGAVALGASAVDGVIALRELAGDMLRDRTAARGSPATFSLYRTSLTADTLPLFRAGLAARGIQFAEGGSLQLADGSNRHVSFTALDAQGRVLFFVRPSEDGRVEILVQNDQAFAAVEAVLSETISELARETLRQQGFSMARQGTGRWVMERRTGDGVREQVVFDFRQGQLNAKAVSVDAEGRILEGNACPDLSAFVDHFTTPTFSPLSGGATSPSRSPQPYSRGSSPVKHIETMREERKQYRRGEP